MTSPVSIPAGHVLTAEDFDAYENLTAAPTAYTPTWTASSVNPAIGNGTITGHYIQVGKLVIARGSVQPGSTTTFGTGSYQVSVPVTANTLQYTAGSLYMLDAGTQNYAGVVYFNSSTTLNLFSSSGQVSPTVPFTWTNGDFFIWTITYWAA